VWRFTHKGIRDPELAGEEVHHRPRHIQRVFGQNRTVPS
jgi:hypothetical protein